MSTPPADDRTPPSASSAASAAAHMQPSSVNDPIAGRVSKRRREETTEETTESHEGNESPATSAEQPQQLAPSSPEEMKSVPSAAAAHSSSPTSMVDDSAAGGVAHIDKRARIDDDRPQQAQSDDLLMSSSTFATSDVAPPVTPTASAELPASSSTPSVASTVNHTPLTSGQISLCIRRAGFDVSHDDAAPDVRELLSQLIAYAWCQLGPTSTRRNIMSLNPPILIGRIDTLLESMARRCNVSYPSKCLSLISPAQQSALDDAIKFILSSLDLDRLELVSQNRAAGGWDHCVASNWKLMTRLRDVCSVRSLVAMCARRPLHRCATIGAL
jgi:hypothetical protein